ncbi:PEP-CTERM sorting domain-containing protein [Massilia sp. DJPM01]|nr:PEP-CTERM sorting domain-containing protein [Massilia sp. DJPM01]MDM5178997.1 PEP-CTERM sorting domain-containing protein [Massilia sp. DJPM01]
MKFGRSLLSALLLGMFAAPVFAAAPSYSVTMLDTGAYENWRLIDNAGTLYGQARGFSAYHSGGATHVMHVSSSQNPEGSVTAISNAGHIASSEYWTLGTEIPSVDGYLTVNGQTTHLRALGSYYTRLDTWANGVNNDGTVVGSSRTDIRLPGGDPYYPRFAVHAYAYSNGAMSDLGTLGGTHSSAAAINAGATIVGNADDKNGRKRAFIYENGRMADLGAFEGGISRAQDINDAGLIIGQSTHTRDQGLLSAFLYSNGVMNDLGWSPRYTSSAVDINNLGQVIGYGADADGQQHGFIYQNGQLVQLDTVVDPSANWVIRNTYSINDHGLILANACKLGVCGTVLLSPVPEPETYALMLAGLGLLGVCARRRTRARASAKQ